jgi:predicted enzyme related to lactoylglutathione lyase
MRILENCFRVYAETAELESLIRFYEELQGVECERRVKIPETATEAAKVGNVLILAGEKRSIDGVKYVDAILYVDSLGDFESWLRKRGAEIIHPARAVTGGRNLTARHPDGLVVEYFEAVGNQ